MEKLKKEEKVYVRELAKEFQVTEETVRRDLERLEKEDLLSRNYGGAVLKAPVADALSFTRRTFVNSDGKERIAARAAAMVAGTASRVMLSAGTTALALLTYLKSERNLTLVTNSARALSLASDAPLAVYSTGGRLNPRAMALVGPTAVKTLEFYNADYAFMGCKGLDKKVGALESDEEEAVIKQTMLGHSARRVLLADKSKFDVAAFVRIAPMASFDTIITDEMPSAEWREILAKNEVELIIAGEG